LIANKLVNVYKAAQTIRIPNFAVIVASVGFLFCAYAAQYFHMLNE